jgi:hypothetical protein
MTLMIACTDAHLNRNTVPSVPKATYLNQMIRINHQQKNAFSFPLKSLNQQKKCSINIFQKPPTQILHKSEKTPRNGARIFPWIFRQAWTQGDAGPGWLRPFQPLQALSEGNDRGNTFIKVWMMSELLNYA